MEDQVAVVFHGGPFNGRMDTIPAVRQPRYFDTPDGGWALYALTSERAGERTILLFQHGSEVTLPEPTSYTRA